MINFAKSYPPMLNLDLHPYLPVRCVYFTYVNKCSKVSRDGRRTENKTQRMGNIVAMLPVNVLCQVATFGAKNKTSQVH